jgi:two-component system, cell cycle sensor histidine kinase PleC
MLSKSNANSRTNSLLSEYSIRVGEAVLRNRTREAEQNARLEAEIANRVKSEFISNMSHELRTPLNTVIGFSKLLAEHERRQLPAEDISEYARLIQDAADHLLSLINDILDISKIQSGRFTLDATEVDIDEVLETVASSFKQAAADANVKLELRVDPAVATCRGDARKLRQAFSNLVSNAVKFTSDGGSVLVEARATAIGGTTVMIYDTGVGMDEEELKVALTPFGQVDGKRSRWREGAGLGLPIAKALIELHGGQIEIESARSKGTKVTIQLPAPAMIAAIEREKAALALAAN